MQKRDFILIPYPKKVEKGEVLVTITPGLIQRINEYKKNEIELEGITLKIDKESIEHEQGYRLVVDDSGIVLTAHDEAGMYHGMMTLRQLCRQVEGSKLSALEIEDWPDFPVRGAMLDISRDRVPKYETLIQLVDLFSEIKINQLQLYVEHTFAYKNHKKVWENASPLTAEEIRSLNTYCAERNIELVPNQNSFGHMERWLIHPEYKHLAETTDGFIDFFGNYIYKPFTLCPSEPGSISLLEELYDELLPNFTSRLFNVGGDETYDLGQGKSKEICEERGKGQVYLDFLKKLHKEVIKRGKTMLFWGDIILRHPELISQLPKDVIALNWGYEDDHPFNKECSEFEKSGITFYVCSGTSAWNSIGGRWNNAKDNIVNACGNGIKNNAEGFLVTNWGDNGHMQQYPIAIPAYLYGAGCSWGLKENIDTDIIDQLSLHVFKDPSKKAATALITLGDVYLKTAPKFHNANLFGVFIFDHFCPYYRESFQYMKDDTFVEAREDIKKAVEMVQEAAMVCDDAKKIVDEVVFTAKFMVFASKLGDARYKAEKFEIAGIPADVRNELAAELNEIINEYKELWMVRSRPGGMSDSVSILESLGDLLK